MCSFLLFFTGLLPIFGGDCLLFAEQPRSASDDRLLRCGSNCLYIALDVFDKAPDRRKVLDDHLGEPSAAGYNLLQLKTAAEHFGLHAEAVETSFENLQARSSPYVLIAHVNNDHFVLVMERKDGKVHLVDPPREFTIPESTFRTQWQGVALLVSNIPLESEESISNRRWRKMLIQRVGGTLAVLAIATLCVRVIKRHR